MFAVKILLEKNKRDKSFTKSFKNILLYLKKLLNDEIFIINDSHCLEVTSGSPEEKDEGVKVELLFKKTIYINKDNFEESLKREIESFNKNTN